VSLSVAEVPVTVLFRVAWLPGLPLNVNALTACVEPEASVRVFTFVPEVIVLNVLLSESTQIKLVPFIVKVPYVFPPPIKFCVTELPVKVTEGVPVNVRFVGVTYQSPELRENLVMFVLVIPRTNPENEIKSLQVITVLAVDAAKLPLVNTMPDALPKVVVFANDTTPAVSVHATFRPKFNVMALLLSVTVVAVTESIVSCPADAGNVQAVLTVKLP
jgi:hypothetical protein